MLAYLARYTHRVAISNSRLIAADEKGVTFKYKDYRIEGPGRYKTMTLAPGEFIRRFLLHVLPKGFHRIRHYGLLAAAAPRPTTLARARELIAAAAPPQPPRPAEQDQAPAGAEATDKPVHPCPCCGSPMLIIELFEAGCDAAQQADRDAGRDQDRHVMMLAAPISPVTPDRLCCWFTAGNDGARPDRPSVPSQRPVRACKTAVLAMDPAIETGVSARRRQRCRLHEPRAGPTVPAKSP